jgi:hypothetical protein
MVRRFLLSVTFSAVIVAAAGCWSGTQTGQPSARLSTRVGGEYAVRGIYDRDFSATGFDHEAALGFNFIDSDPFDDFDKLVSHGLRGFVWLGGYSNVTCSFREGEDWIRQRVSVIAGSPGVGAYFIDDEPDAARCPRAPAQMKARSDLVKSIDPGPPTFLVTYRIDQIKLFAGTVDVIGLDGYPCSIAHGCDFSKIEGQAAVADRLGIRYWGVIQAFGDDWYKLPTADELHQQFVHWWGTKMEGYLVFAWHHPDGMRSLWLANHPRMQNQLAEDNARSWVAPDGIALAPRLDAQDQ